MEPYNIDWQLETDYEISTNPKFAPFQHRHRHHYDHVHLHTHQEYQDEDEDEHEDEDEDGNDLYFTFAYRASESSPVSADEIFFNGQIKPLNPNFKPIVLNHEPAHRVNKNETVSNNRLPLLKLMSQEEDRDFSFTSTASSSSSSSSCSSSEVAEEEDDEPEGIAPESYCVWRPPNAKKEKSRRRSKSNFTGTKSSSSKSKRWTLRDMLLNKSLSDKSKASKPSCIGQLYR